MGISFNSFSFANAEASGLNIVAISRKKGEEIPPSITNSIGGEDVKVFEWQSTSKIKITLTDNSITANNVSLKIDCFKEYASPSLDLTSANRSSVENLTNGKVEGTTFSYEYDIDKGVSQSIGAVTTSVKGWGIYKFTLSVGSDKTFTSSLYNIIPNGDLYEPIFNVREKKNESESHNDFVCNILNKDDFKYADTSKITWYVEGVDENNKHYCLTTADRNSTYNNPLYNNDEIERNGLSFTFNPKIDGKWSIHCVFKPDESKYVESDTITLDDNQNFNVTVFIICLSSVAVLSCGILALWQFIKTKREKVW